MYRLYETIYNNTFYYITIFLYEEKYISNNLVKSNTKIICLCHDVTFLFMYYQDLAKQLLSDYEYEEEIIDFNTRKNIMVEDRIGVIFRYVFSRKKSLMGFIKDIYLKTSIIHLIILE